jgi:hypothetical protein
MACKKGCDDPCKPKQSPNEPTIGVVIVTHYSTASCKIHEHAHNTHSTRVPRGCKRERESGRARTPSRALPASLPLFWRQPAPRTFIVWPVATRSHSEHPCAHTFATAAWPAPHLRLDLLNQDYTKEVPILSPP